jgi:hypothetical protein
MNREKEQNKGISVALAEQLSHTLRKGGTSLPNESLAFSTTHS